MKNCSQNTKQRLLIASRNLTRVFIVLSIIVPTLAERAHGVEPPSQPQQLEEAPAQERIVEIDTDSKGDDEVQTDGFLEGSSPIEQFEPEPVNIFNEAYGKALRWKLNPGDLIEIKKDSRQTIQFMDGASSEEEKRTVKHRVLFDIREKDPEQGYLIDASFRSQFRDIDDTHSPYQAEENHDATFFIQPRGKFVVDSESFMPSVRDVPYFPEEEDPNSQTSPMEVGDKWSLPGREILFDGRKIEIPMEVRYEYLGRQRYKTDNDQIRLIHKIRYNIEINHEISDAAAKGGPQKVVGYSINLLAWDEKQGMPYFEQEEYNLILIYPDGFTVEWKATAVQTFRKIERPSVSQNNTLRDELITELENIEGATQPQVEKQEEGIAIQLPDILFAHNSAKLNHDAKEVLTKIAETLARYPDRHFLIKGHTDNTGSEEYNQDLSTQRAKTVAEYLIQKGRLNEQTLSFTGLGSSRPREENSTTAGRQKNRRVEIIILDK